MENDDREDDGPEENRGEAEISPEDVPSFEGQIVFKGDFESSTTETIHEECRDR
jgi:hypothetical protein